MTSSRQTGLFHRLSHIASQATKTLWYAQSEKYGVSKNDKSPPSRLCAASYIIRKSLSIGGCSTSRMPMRSTSPPMSRSSVNCGSGLRRSSSQTAAAASSAAAYPLSDRMERAANIKQTQNNP